MQCTPWIHHTDCNYRGSWPCTGLRFEEHKWASPTASCRLWGLKCFDLHVAHTIQHIVYLVCSCISTRTIKDMLVILQRIIPWIPEPDSLWILSSLEISSTFPYHELVIRARIAAFSSRRIYDSLDWFSSGRKICTNFRPFHFWNMIIHLMLVVHFSKRMYACESLAIDDCNLIDWRLAIWKLTYFPYCASVIAKKSFSMVASSLPRQAVGRSEYMMER